MLQLKPSGNHQGAGTPVPVYAAERKGKAVYYALPQEICPPRASAKGQFHPNGKLDTPSVDDPPEQGRAIEAEFDPVHSRNVKSASAHARQSPGKARHRRNPNVSNGPDTRTLTRDKHHA